MRADDRADCFSAIVVFLAIECGRVEFDLNWPHRVNGFASLL